MLSFSSFSVERQNLASDHSNKLSLDILTPTGFAHRKKRNSAKKYPTQQIKPTAVVQMYLE